MLPARILILAAFPLLTACGGWKPGGSSHQSPDLPAPARVPCPQPASLLGGSDYEIIAGRIGDALIECEGRRQIAVAAFDGAKAGGRR